MASRLPETISPRRLARGGTRLEGHVTTHNMVRLRRICEDNAADVKVRLEFGISDRRIPFVQGQIITALQVLCQRCLEPMAVHLNVGVSAAMGLPSDSGAEAVATSAEALEIGNDAVSLIELVEDELLLALPDYPMHPVRSDTGPDQCVLSPEYAWGFVNPDLEQSIGDQSSPFSALKGLLASATDKSS